MRRQNRSEPHPGYLHPRTAPGLLAPQPNRELTVEISISQGLLAWILEQPWSGEGGLVWRGGLAPPTVLPTSTSSLFRSTSGPSTPFPRCSESMVLSKSSLGKRMSILSPIATRPRGLRMQSASFAGAHSFHNELAGRSRFSSKPMRTRDGHSVLRAAGEGSRTGLAPEHGAKHEACG